MLDMQNVKDIQITEGAVRTIHDKDNRLIWGRVNYDTKYVGDTVQDGIPAPDAPVPVQVVTGAQTVTVSDGGTSQSYPLSLTGKNLFDVSTFVMGGMSNGQVTVMNYRITNITNPLEVKPSTKYTISVQLGGDIQGFRIGIHQLDENKAFLADSGWQQLVPNPYTFTTRADAKYIGIVCSCSATSTTVTTGSTESHYGATTPTQWLRGCKVSVNESGTAIELCKIGDYQDYIYKSGDDWYVHKLIEKLVANGSEDWTRNGINRQDLEMPNAVTGSQSNNPVMSARYVSRFSTSVNNSVFLSAYHRLCVYDTAHANNTEAWKTWLASNNTTFYYALITPTDTQITDATLVGQLNAVHEWLTRYGYTSTVTGNLPLIINQTNL